MASKEASVWDVDPSDKRKHCAEFSDKETTTLIEVSGFSL